MPDAGTQTDLTGPVQSAVRPDTLFSAPRDTPTPPDEMIREKPHLADTHSHHQDHKLYPTSTLHDRRQNRIDRIAMPPLDLDDQTPLSPPPTHALRSPLPEQNTRHAGHTPLIPRALSPTSAEPVRQQAAVEDGVATPDADQGLSGPLTLPTNPIEGAEDHIMLDELDNKLMKMAKQQATLRGDLDDEPKPKPLDTERSANPTRTPQDTLLAELETDTEGMSLSRKRSAEARRSDHVDGVTLKTPPSNFGAPMGQLP